MKEFEYFLKAFDTEVEQIAITSLASKRKLLRNTADKLRRGLTQFYALHRRLPETIGELKHSEFSTKGFLPFMKRPHFHDHEAESFTVESFLRRTQEVVDGRDDFPTDQTKFALKLVHAVYRAHRPTSRWHLAAKTLAARGFTEEQITLLRTDARVRKACRKLLQPYER